MDYTKFTFNAFWNCPYFKIIKHNLVTWRSFSAGWLFLQYYRSNNLVMVHKLFFITSYLPLSFFLIFTAFTLSYQRRLKFYCEFINSDKLLRKEIFNMLCLKILHYLGPNPFSSTEPRLKQMFNIKEMAPKIEFWKYF